MAMEKSQRSLNSFVREAVAAGPIRTLRTGGSVRIVNAFFMGTADDAVGNHSRAGSVRLEEGHDLLADSGITTHIQLAIGKPALEKIRFVIVGKNDADGDFGSHFVGRAIEGQNCNGVTLKRLTGFVP
jgi:hypothetical protein